jgi:hypothetical protein
MRAIVSLLLLICITGTSFASNDIWIPKASFQLENSDLRQTMLFVSGISYGLTEYTQQLAKTGKPQLFCPTGRGLVESRMIFEILNSRFAGKKITAEQATDAAFAGLRDRFPCK